MSFPHINGSASISHPLTASIFSNEPSMGLGLPPLQQGWLCEQCHIVPPATPSSNCTMLYATNVTAEQQLDREGEKQRFNVVKLLLSLLPDEMSTAKVL